MKVLVVSEGNHEMDWENADGESSLTMLVKRVVPDVKSCERRRVSDRCVQAQMKPGKGFNYEKRLLAWLRHAVQQHFDAIVIVVDEDGHKSRQQGVEAAQASPAITVPRALGLAIRSFDAWMVADEKALSQVLGNTIQRRPDPESLTDPKTAFQELLRVIDLEAPISISNLYTEVAKFIDFEQLKKRCPKGFGTFHERLKALSPST